MRVDNRQCPECGHKGPFLVQAVTWLQINSDGEVDPYGSQDEYDMDSPRIKAMCMCCDHEALWSTFIKEGE